MLNIAFLPATRTIDVADLKDHHIIFTLTDTCASFLTASNVYRYDGRTYFDARCFDLFRADNFEGVGPFAANWHFSHDDGVKVEIVTEEFALLISLLIASTPAI